MDRSGKTVISPQFDDEGDFFGGSGNGKKSFIRDVGNILRCATIHPKVTFANCATGSRRICSSRMKPLPVTGGSQNSSSRAVSG
jgi:hypothetical protein